MSVTESGFLDKYPNYSAIGVKYEWGLLSFLGIRLKYVYTELPSQRDTHYMCLVSVWNLHIHSTEE